MGKGDKKSRRGKITMGTFGVRRPRKKTKAQPKVTTAKTKAKPTSAKATATKPVAKPKATPKKKATTKKAATKKDDKK